MPLPLPLPAAAVPAAAASASDVVPSPDNGRSAAAAPGAYLGNAEPTIWRRPTILTIGDSITEGGLDPEGGWTVRLASAYARKVGLGFCG